MRQSLLLFLFFSPSFMFFAQIKIGDNPGVIQSGALVDLESTNKGLLLPRIALMDTTLSSPLPSHVAGMTIYNTANTGNVKAGYYYNNGSAWIRLAKASESVILANNGLTKIADTAKWGGAIIEPTTISGITSTNSLSFNGTGVNAFSIDTNTLSVDFTNNRVGIGTIAPQFKTHVVSNSLFAFALERYSSGSGNQPVITLRKNNSDNPNVLVPLSTGTIIGRIGFSGVNTNSSFVSPQNSPGLRAVAAGNFSNTSAPSYLSFLTTPVNSINAIPRMVIRENGFVGIGTIFEANTPQQMLHLHNSIPSAGTSPLMIKLTNHETGNSINDGMQVGLDGNNGTINVLENSPLLFGTNNVERMRISNTGNIGIGTTTPNYRLDVNGSINVSNNQTIHYNGIPDFRLVIREDYETPVSGWTNNTRTSIGGAQILGGYNVLAGTTISKTFDLTGIPHNEVMVKFTYYSIDSWDAETAYASIVNTGGYWNFKNIVLSDPGRAEIGGIIGWLDGLIDGQMNVSHSSNSITILFGSNLNEAANNESFGIDNLEIWVR